MAISIIRFLQNQTAQVTQNAVFASNSIASESPWQSGSGVLVEIFMHMISGNDE